MGSKIEKQTWNDWVGQNTIYLKSDQAKFVREQQLKSKSLGSSFSLSTLFDDLVDFYIKHQR